MSSDPEVFELYKLLGIEGSPTRTINFWRIIYGDRF